MAHDFSVGDQVTFRTPGLHAAQHIGTVQEIAPGNWLVVKCDDGKTRKTRPGACAKVT